MIPAELVSEMRGSWPATLSAVHSVRGAVRTWLREEELDVLEDVCLLVVSELTTNSVVHAGTPFDLTITRLLDGLLVQVHDDSASAPRPDDRPALTAVSGRGMFLVDALCEEWGVVQDGAGGKATWAVVAATTPATGPSGR